MDWEKDRKFVERMLYEERVAENASCLKDIPWFLRKNELEQFIEEAGLLLYCAPIFFLPSENATPDTIYANGTVGLIDTGKKKLLVTCAHVWSEFLNYRSKNPLARLSVIFENGPGLPEQILDSSLLGFDDGIDMAVFEAHPERWRMGKKQFHRVPFWPIPKARDGDLVAFLGFSGRSRKTNPQLGMFNYSVFGMTVTNSSDRKIIFASPEGGRRVLNNDDNPVPGLSIGGMSGSPAFVRDHFGEFHLTGFIQMGRDSSSHIFATHAFFLNADGSLRR